MVSEGTSPPYLRAPSSSEDFHWVSVMESAGEVGGGVKHLPSLKSLKEKMQQKADPSPVPNFGVLI